MRIVFFTVLSRVQQTRKIRITTGFVRDFNVTEINKIDSMLRMPNCPFVLYVGTKKLVKRREFEQFISQKLTI